MDKGLQSAIEHLERQGCWAFVVVGLRKNTVTGKTETNAVWPENFDAVTIVEILTNGIEQVIKESGRHDN